jgi:hypothetical protein
MAVGQHLFSGLVSRPTSSNTFKEIAVALKNRSTSGLVALDEFEMVLQSYGLKIPSAVSISTYSNHACIRS